MASTQIGTVGLTARDIGLASILLQPDRHPEEMGWADYVQPDSWSRAPKVVQVR